MQYTFSQIPGKKINAIQKLSDALSVSAHLIVVSDTYGQEPQTHITFKGITLTEEQEQTLFSLVNSSICSVPEDLTKTTYRIPNIWGMREKLKEIIGADVKFWLGDEKEDGSEDCYIYIQFPRALTSTEKILRLTG